MLESPGCCLQISFDLGIAVCPLWCVDFSLPLLPIISAQLRKMNFSYWRFLVWVGSFFLRDVCKVTKGLWMLTKNEVWNTVVATIAVAVTVVILTKR